MDLDNVDGLVFVLGHRIDGHAYEWPHWCPGAACAVYRWLESLHKRTHHVPRP
jgi:hypothetical protein